jgi:hypothetical protein
VQADVKMNWGVTNVRDKRPQGPKRCELMKYGNDRITVKELQDQMMRMWKLSEKMNENKLKIYAWATELGKDDQRVYGTEAVGLKDEEKNVG